MFDRQLEAQEISTTSTRKNKLAQEISSEAYGIVKMRKKELCFKKLTNNGNGLGLFNNTPSNLLQTKVANPITNHALSFI